MKCVNSIKYVCQVSEKKKKKRHSAYRLLAPQGCRSALFLSDLREAFVWAAAGHNLEFFFNWCICV